MTFHQKIFSRCLSKSFPQDLLDRKATFSSKNSPRQTYQGKILLAPPFAPTKKNKFPYVLAFVCALCIWLVWRSVTPTLPLSTTPPKLYYHPSREDLRLTLLSAIQNSKESIFLSIFGLSDPTILTALQKKIQKKVPTLIYYDAKGSPDIRKILEGAVLRPIHQSAIMHHKMLILDHKLIFLGSANFTPHSLKMHDNLVIGFYSPKIAQFLEQKTPHSTGHIRTFVGGQSVELWLLPDPKGHAFNDLRKKLKSAQKSLKIALFTLTHPTLLDEIIAAHKRHLDVTVIIDMHSSMGASKKAIDTLQAAHVPIRFTQGPQLMHHKFAYIDDEILITGSANWTKAAFSKNNDCLFTLYHLTSEQKRLMNGLWKSLKTTSKTASPQKQT